MALTQAFYDAVNSGNVRKVRIMMKNSLLFDPSFEQFNEMEREAKRRLNNLYEKHDGRTFNNDKNSWNDDYMNQLMVQVISNFSHERVEHLKEVVRTLRPDFKKPSENSRRTENTNGNSHRSCPQSSYQRQKQQDEKDNRIKEEVFILAGAGVGALVGGAVASAPGAFIGAVAGGAAGGTIGHFMTNGGE